MNKHVLVTDCLVTESGLEYSFVDNDIVNLTGESVSTKKKGDKTPLIQGIYGEADSITSNRRLYPQDEMVLATENIQPAIEKCLYGEFEHPKTHIVRPERAIIKIRKLWMDGKYLMGESVPAATPLGDWYTRIIVEDGYVLPVSIRSLCRLVKKNGYNMCKDVNLCTVDAVVVNAAKKAVPGVVFESVPGLAEAGLISPEEANRIELFERKVDSKTALNKRKRALGAFLGGIHQAFGDLYK